KDNGEVTVVILSWEGSDPSLPSIMLNSHMDVVPVFPEHWTYEPFSAHKTENGNIYARGSQDMKCVGIQYIEAIRKLKTQGVTLARTLHVTFVPDEEIGGVKGMREFVKLDEFKTMNVGFALDEGLANPTDAFKIYYGERITWWVKITCRGPPGHASSIVQLLLFQIRITLSFYAKSRPFILFLFDKRNTQGYSLLICQFRLDSNPELRLGDVTTVNWTVSEGGVQPNVVPSDMSSVFDIRITPTTDIEEFEKMIKRWCEEAGEGVDFELLQGARTWGITSTADDDPWWSVLSSTCKKMGLTLEKEIFPAGTDSRFLRELGYPAIGFSPMNNTPILLHDHDEFLNESVFLRGIEIYCEIITALGNRAPFNG
ncbi:PREDICTED: aminoacylase-1-like, partial [Acropora digitifera]|uniref:aminoacylase-1-like n=1 Tax=Acropora digitifera TaxID=70779 RepID=UPI00077AB84F